MDTGKFGLGLGGKVGAAVGYPIGIIAIICLIMEKENRFVKFHALQSILLHVAFIVVAIGVWIIGIILVIVGVAASAATNSSAFGGLFRTVFGVSLVGVGVGDIGWLIYAPVEAHGG